MRVIALFAFCFSNVAWAKTLTLREALQQGMTYSLEVQQAESRSREADANYRAARSLIFPTIDLEGAYGHRQSTAAYTTRVTSATGSETDVNQAFVKISQPLYSGGALWSGLKAATLNQDAAKQNLLATRQDYALSVIRAYLTAAAYQALLDLAKKNRDASKDYFETTKRYAKIGRSKNIDRLSSEASFALSEAEVLDVASLTEQSFADLQRLLGIAEMKDVQLERPKNIAPPTQKPLDQLLNEAVERNPSIKSTQLQIESLKRQIDVELSGHLPSLSLDGSYGFDSPERRNLFDNYAETYSVFLNLKIPLFSGFGYSADRDRAREQLNQLEKQLEIDRRTLYQTISKTLASLNANFARLKLTETAAERAHQATGMALRDYRNGLISNGDVLQIQNTRYNADRQNTNAQLNYQIQAAQFQHALGLGLEQSYSKN